MLPARPEMNRTNRADENPQVHPGTWWRLADETHEWMKRPMPAHGLVLMVQEVRIVDGEMHTIIMHPHPTWKHAQKGYSCRMLVEEFLLAFRPESKGDVLRENEIAEVMGRVQAIADEIASPPAPALLLEKQKDKEAAKAASNPEPEKQAKVPSSDRSVTGAERAIVPAALLPSQDITAAQEAIENRIAAFTAQKNWIEDRTTKLQSEMGLVSIYQTEKVHTALAGISQETKRAEGLLENVQTMRLFLGEDMAVTPLRDGKSADPSLPLTFLQRMLYLDEELFVHNIVDGFDGDMMEDLPQLLQDNMPLVERMLPYERSVAITRVRRHARELNIAEGSTVTEIINAIFAHMEIAEADMRIQILVRDGERVHMITCDEATSNAERLFPSRSEIDALFKTSSHSNSREITPHDLDYTDARARHDTRALFYKRFLLILWGVHERTDIFGDFTPKGSNWLDETIHSERFHFVHDEEEVLEDGRPSIHAYWAARNKEVKSGSRVLVDWYRVASPDTAPGCYTYDGHRDSLNGEFVNKQEVASVFAENGTLKAKAAFQKGRFNYSNKPKKPVNAKVTLVYPASFSRPDQLFEKEVAQGFICLDNLTLAEIDYYINSRKARKDYAKYMTHFNAARIIIRDEEKRAASILSQLAPNADSTEADLFAKALRTWREANKWGWPETDKQVALIRKLVDLIAKPQAIAKLAASHKNVLRAEIKANGDIVITTAPDMQVLEGGIVLPWVTETTYGTPASKKPKSEERVSFFEMGPLGRFKVFEDKEVYDKTVGQMTQEAEYSPYLSRNVEPIKVKNWRVPRAFATSGAQKGFESIKDNGKAVDIYTRVLKGEDPLTLDDWREELIDAYKTTKDRHVLLPEHCIDLGLLYGFDGQEIPRVWSLRLSCVAPLIGLALGDKSGTIRWADSIYQNPESVVDRWDSKITANGNPWTLSICALGLKNPITQSVKKGVYLSFDERDTMSHWGVPKDEGLSWHEKAARLITKPLKGGWDMKWAADDLRAKAKDLHFIGAPGAEDLLKIAAQTT